MSVTDGAVQPARIGTSLDLSEHPSRLRALETREPVVVASIDDPRLTDESRAANRALGEKSWLDRAARGQGQGDRARRSGRDAAASGRSASRRSAPRRPSAGSRPWRSTTPISTTASPPRTARPRCSTRSLARPPRAWTSVRSPVPRPSSCAALVPFENKRHGAHRRRPSARRARRRDGAPVRPRARGSAHRRCPGGVSRGTPAATGHRAAPARRQPPGRGDTPSSPASARPSWSPSPSKVAWPAGSCCTTRGPTPSTRSTPGRSSASAPILPSPSRTPASTRTSRPCT